MDVIINEFKQSINKTDDDLQALSKEELCQLIHFLRKRLFNNNREQPNQAINYLLEPSENQRELLQKLIDILSNPISFTTMIKLSLLFLFIWIVETHTIDFYIKHK